MDAATLLADLVAIDSVNPALVPGAAGEAEIAAHVASWLRERGLEATVIEEAAGRPSVVGIARGSGSGASLMLNGHLDTVGVAGMAATHDPQVRDGRLHGRGSFDMKGGVAACMLAGAAAVGAGLRDDVIVAAVADEEHAIAGMQAVLRRFPADACVVTEPTHLRARVAHMGFGGQELSSYPARCVLGVERRTLPGERAADITRELEELLALARAVRRAVRGLGWRGARARPSGAVSRARRVEERALRAAARRSADDRDRGPDDHLPEREGREHDRGDRHAARGLGDRLLAGAQGEHDGRDTERPADPEAGQRDVEIPHHRRAGDRQESQQQREARTGAGRRGDVDGGVDRGVHESSRCGG